MRACLLCAVCPAWAERARRVSPPADGGGQEGAMAGYEMEAHAARCVWRGDYTTWKEKGTPLNEFSVGLVTPDQVVTLLKRARYLEKDASELEAKLLDINWKALTGFLYEKNFEEWRIQPLGGKEICETLENSGLQLTSACLAGSNTLGA